ncbi:carboxymuconolactone decarboxylase family protein [Sneathiella sp. P13V-1]|uniref:carboxymuconolactone decarboxylase family protein n=1 Tax=Sneathiella sp. P13V-1 TaxID=2697366 RepID=UPI00187BB2DF|nr:carboxymuconolactone decarboxylase family protein [Sneathiella sp. P13V-1]
MMTSTDPISYETEIPDILKSMQAVHGTILKSDLDKLLQHLILLRASQMNGCKFCIDMHTREALEDGESQERLDQVASWRNSDLFSDAERAGLAWTEELTDLGMSDTYKSNRAELRRYFSDRQIGGLTAAVGMINFWNRIQVSKY